MPISNKQFRHYQSVARQSLDTYKKIAEAKKIGDASKLLIADWQAFVDDPVRIKRYVDHVDEVAGILGFSRELSNNLSNDALMSRVAERFAEVDLAEHAIRELGLSKAGGKLEKLIEGVNKRCDFKFLTYYFESKYTKNISVASLTEVVEEALNQIKNSMDGNGTTGCVWIFTYTQPDDPRQFQQEVEAIKRSFSQIGFDFKLNVQVYGRGLYGDATII